MLVTRERELVGHALAALASTHDPGIECEVLLVLNRCAPSVLDFVDEEIAGATVIETRFNVGTAVAWNLAADIARAPLLVTLHEDAETQPGWLGSLLASRDRERPAGVTGARLLQPSGAIQNGGWVLWRDGTHSPVTGEGMKDFLARTDPYPVDFVSPATMLLERRLWESIGGFDERYYPAIFTDIDFCTAAWESGREVVSAPGAHVVHRSGALVHGRSALGSKNYQDFLRDRNRVRFQRKWHARLAHQLAAKGARRGETLSPEITRAGLELVRRRPVETDARERTPIRASRSLSRPEGAGPPLQRSHNWDWETTHELGLRLTERELEVCSEFADDLHYRLRDAETASASQQGTIASQGKAIMEHERSIEALRRSTLRARWSRLRGGLRRAR